MRKILKLLTSKTMYIGLIVLAQLVFVAFFVDRLVSDNYIGIYLHFIFIGLSFLIILHLISSDINPEFKIAWLLPVIAFPILGTFFYLFYRRNNVRPKQVKKYNKITENRNVLLKHIPNKLHFKEIKYLNNNGWRYYSNTTSKFLNSGEEKLKEVLIELEKAEKFILMEYFIISKGYMYDQIFEVLIRKANEGVSVKIIYDDFGCADKIGLNFKKKMNEKGIKAIPFNKMTFHVNFAQNYRTHRKILVIDNKVGFTGGVNIGDEYINKKKRFGHWSDAAIKIEGEAVWSLTINFLENFAFQSKEIIDYTEYYLDYKVQSEEIIAPFGDNPIEQKQITRSVLLHLINEAKHEINITAPYLIVDNELKTALKLAAKSGITVNIIIPGIPDKKLVYLVSEYFAKDLIIAGVNIYKYTPGFIHSKLFVIDNKKALIGTTNLDFRSLYLHFENNIYLYNSKSVTEINNSIKETILVSKLQSEQLLEKKGLLRLIQAILRGFSAIL